MSEVPLYAPPPMFGGDEDGCSAHGPLVRPYT